MYEIAITCTCICVRFAVNGLAYTTKSLLYFSLSLSLAFSHSQLLVHLSLSLSLLLRHSMSISYRFIFSIFPFLSVSLLIPPHVIYFHFIWFEFIFPFRSGIYLTWSECWTAFKLTTMPSTNYKRSHAIQKTHRFKEKSILFDRRISNWLKREKCREFFVVLLDAVVVVVDFPFFLAKNNRSYIDFMKLKFEHWCVQRVEGKPLFLLRCFHYTVSYR